MAIDLEKLRRECVYQAQAPLGSVLGDVAEIVKADQHFAQVRKSRIGMGFACLGAVVVGVLMAAFVEALVLAGVLVAIGGVVCAVVVWVKAYGYGRNLKQYAWRYGLLGQLGAALQQDSDPKAPVTVSLGLKNQGRLLKEEVWPVRKRGKQRFTEDDWLTMQGRFLDGTEYWETVGELVRTRMYVNPRGKSKVKVRSRHFVSIRLGCPKELYGELGPMEEGLRKTLRLPPSATVRRLKAGGKSIAIRVRVDERSDLAKANVMMFLGLYRALNLARQLQGRLK